MSKNIIFTGGGSGGHVVPAITLIKLLINDEYNISYIGGRDSIEQELIPPLNISYYPIMTGKLRRYISFQNFLDIFKVTIGIIQSCLILLRFNKKNTIIFSTGGFVSVPVVIASWITGKTIFLHEQTTRAGLANRICAYFANKIFLTFEESAKYFPSQKAMVSGYPLRDECFANDIKKVEIDGITINKIAWPILLVTGGGNGAQIINETIKKYLPKLEEKFFIIHQVGKLFIEEYKKYKSDNYHPVAFIKDEMIDLYKMATIIISRAGAGTVCELLALNKRSIFVPLKIAQKNEQYHNAEVAKKKIGSSIILEDNLAKSDLVKIINDFANQREDDTLEKDKLLDAKTVIIEHLQIFFEEKIKA